MLPATENTPGLAANEVGTPARAAHATLGGRTLGEIYYVKRKSEDDKTKPVLLIARALDARRAVRRDMLAQLSLCVYE